MVIEQSSSSINQLASKLLHFYLATGRFPSTQEHNATQSAQQQAMELLTRNGYLPSQTSTSSRISA